TINNVVNYTAVVAVENPNGKLLPGMTATVKFLVGSVDDALTVPNAALRFKPAVVATMSTGTKRSASDSTRVRSAARDSTMTTLWSLDSTNALKPVRVHAGLTDGTRTQVSGTSLEEGMQIVIGASTGTTPEATTTTSKNPLQPQSTGRRGGPAGPF
ncbi:MAG: hypothetical protein ACRENC_04755, partial [Gemmatimonadaceae bacterium]